MAVVNNKFTRTTDFFKSHLPFQSPTGTFPTNKLSDMVFINYVVPSEPIKINQIYGANLPFEFIIVIENKTTNISLEFELIYEKHFKISTPNKFVIVPRTQQDVPVSVDNSYINTLSTTPINKTNFKILVKNLSSELAYIPIEVTRSPSENIRLSRKSFDSEITVD
jgi:hypothetical protein